MDPHSYQAMLKESARKSADFDNLKAFVADLSKLSVQHHITIDVDQMVITKANPCAMVLGFDITDIDDDGRMTIERRPWP